MASALLLGFYVLAVIPWIWLSILLWRRRRNWGFTPGWHRLTVPVFRALLIVTLPVEQLVENRPFVPVAFVLGAVATVAWLAVRAGYLMRAEEPYPAVDSVSYNLWYVANLASFAVTMHSWVCLAVMLNISLPALWIRYRYSLATRDPAEPVPHAHA